MFQKCILALIALTMATGTALCEEDKPPKYYKIEFIIKEVEGGKPLNSRAYVTMVAAPQPIQGSANIRVVSKVPFASKQGASPEIQQVSVGVSIDVRYLTADENHLRFLAGVDVSSVVEAGSTPEVRVIRQNAWNSAVEVQLKKPTTVFTSDTFDAKRQMQVEITATPLP